MKSDNSMRVIALALFICIAYTVKGLGQDVGITGITSPATQSAGCAPLGSSVSVTVTLRNFTTTPVPAGTIIPVQLSLNGTAPVMTAVTLGSALNSNGTALIALPGSANLDLSATISYTLTVATMMPGDLNPANDSATKIIRTIVSAFPWIESFATISAGNNSTNPPLPWAQDSQDAMGADSNWYFRNLPDTTAGTSPPSDHTTGSAGAGYYAVVDDDGDHAQVRLLSPCLDLSALTNPRLTFWYNVANAEPALSSNALSVDIVSHPSGAIALDVIPPISMGGMNWRKGFVDLSSFSGVIQIVFRANSNGGSTRNNIAIDDIQVSMGNMTDLALIDLVTPVSAPECALLSANESISIEVQNQGVSVIQAGTVISAQYSIDGGSAISSNVTVPQALATGSSTILVIPQTADLSTPGLHSIALSVVLPGDQDPSNDLLPPFVVSSNAIQSSFPWLETFDSLGPIPASTTSTVPPPGWTQDAADGLLDWRFSSTSTPNVGTGPQADHTTGIASVGTFAFVNPTVIQAAVQLRTPCMDIGALARPTLAFWYHSRSVAGTSQALLHVDLIQFPMSNVVMDIVPPIGSDANEWRPAVVDLSPYSGIVQVQFRFQVLVNSLSQHDIAIDDVFIGEGDLAGSGDDLEILTTVDGQGVPTLGGKVALQGGLLGITIDSTNGSYWGLPPILAAQVYSTGNPPTGIGAGAFPSVHLDVPAAIVVFDGHTQGLFGPTVLGPGGVGLSFVCPAGLAGSSVRLQGVVVSAATNNAIFAITDAHDFIFQ